MPLSTVSHNLDRNLAPQALARARAYIELAKAEPDDDMRGVHLAALRSVLPDVHPDVRPALDKIAVKLEQAPAS